jgi:hypothetical protein
MISLSRTTDVPPLAVLLAGQSDARVFAWAELLSLRDLVTQVADPDALAADEDNEFPTQTGGEWSASGSSFGIALERNSPPWGTLYLEADDWRTLARLIYAGDKLFSQVESSQIAKCPQPRIAEAIAAGRLFAFQQPDMERRQWLIPSKALAAWTHRTEETRGKRKSEKGGGRHRPRRIVDARRKLTLDILAKWQEAEPRDLLEEIERRMPAAYLDSQDGAIGALGRDLAWLRDTQKAPLSFDRKRNVWVCEATRPKPVAKKPAAKLKAKPKPAAKKNSG